MDQLTSAFIGSVALSLLGLIIFTAYWVVVIRFGVKLGMRAALRERDEERAEQRAEQQRATQTRTFG